MAQQKYSPEVQKLLDDLAKHGVKFPTTRFDYANSRPVLIPPAKTLVDLAVELKADGWHSQFSESETGYVAAPHSSLDEGESEGIYLYFKDLDASIICNAETLEVVLSIT